MDVNRPVTIPEAARALGVSDSTLRRWLKAGAPVVRRGRKGRGGQTLIDVGAVQAWRGMPGTPVGISASQVAGLVAKGVEDAFRDADGPHKAAAAALMVATWYHVSARILEAMGDPDPDIIPPEVERLLQIAHR